MALLPATLINEFNAFFDQENALFQGFPQSQQDAAQLWADAVATYALAITPPSTTNQAAKAAMIGQLNQINNEAANGIVIISVAFTAFATQLALGMAPFVGTPPPVPVDLSPVYNLGFSGAPASICLQTMAGIIDTWFRTGLATPAVGSPVLWS